MPAKLPSEAYQLAERYRLGKLTAIYVPHFRTFLKNFWSVRGCIVIGIFVVKIAAAGIPPRSSDVVLYLLYYWGFWILLAGLILFFFVLPFLVTSGHKIYIGSDGMVYRKRRGDTVISWEQIEQVGIRGIILKDGTRIKLPVSLERANIRNNIKRKLKRLYEQPVAARQSVDMGEL
ncbi:MAG: hypothetical protein J2P36_28695 [Ktedonobacteraceae bacterium]|nr:hypothetical protein [Ktedonobacteraceae bacterium]